MVLATGGGLQVSGFGVLQVPIPLIIQYVNAFRLIFAIIWGLVKCVGWVVCLFVFNR